MRGKEAGVIREALDFRSGLSAMTYDCVWKKGILVTVNGHDADPYLLRLKFFNPSAYRFLVNHKPGKRPGRR